MKKSKEINQLVLTGIISALIIIMSFIPFLGYIPLGFINATIIQIPVIIGAMMLGTKKGAFLGLVFGLTSLWKNTSAPNLTSFVFSPFVPVPGFLGEQSFGMFLLRVLKSGWISVLSRVMIGVAVGLLYSYLKKSRLRKRTQYLICGAAGAFTNTVLVMGGIYFLYGEAFAGAKGIAAAALSKAIAGVVFMQGIPEAAVSALIVSVIMSALNQYYHKI